MKKFKFRLETLLKFRKFREKELKIQLGEIVKYIEIVRQEIVELNQAIDDCYESQSSLMNDTIKGRMIQFVPYFVEGKRAHIKSKENLLYALQKKYDAKVAEVRKAMGDVKVIDKMKHKEIALYNRELVKKEREQNEEVTNRKFVLNDTT